MSNDDDSITEVWRPLLELACRETLRELAHSAVHLESGGGAPRSVESIVQEVAAKVLAEAGPPRMPGGDSAGGASARDAPVVPLLADVTGSPWVVWRKGTARRNDVGENPVVLDDSSPSDWSPHSGTHWTRAVTSNAFSPFGDASPRAGFLQSEPEEETPVANDAVFGRQPIVVRNGLTIETHTAEHLVMQWQGRPKSVLIVAKKGDVSVTSTLQDMAAWLSSQGIVVVLEPSILADNPHISSSLRGARVFSKADKLENSIDFVITIGGDGTLTWAVSLFGRAMPPVLSLAAESRSCGLARRFHTPFPLKDWVHTLTPIFNVNREREPLPLVCRMRLRVAVRRGGDAPPRDGDSPVEVLCLNEVLVHRGGSGALSKLDVSVDGEHVTLVQGDGVILATPTGSTAYSLAAGGSMAHPAVPAMLLTPVSPHSLSFRPAVLPDSATVTIGIPSGARAGAALSVDGKDICVLSSGDSVEVASSLHPVPTICRATETKDWFSSVREALQWNGRSEPRL